MLNREEFKRLHKKILDREAAEARRREAAAWERARAVALQTKGYLNPTSSLTLTKELQDEFHLRAVASVLQVPPSGKPHPRVQSGPDQASPAR